MPRILRAEPKAPSKTVGSRTAQLVTALYESGQCQRQCNNGSSADLVQVKGQDPAR